MRLKNNIGSNLYRKKLQTELIPRKQKSKKMEKRTWKQPAPPPRRRGRIDDWSVWYTDYDGVPTTRESSGISNWSWFRFSYMYQQEEEVDNKVLEESYEKWK